jgi:site-specific DNA-methyltransferase (adenine-specific)
MAGGVVSFIESEGVRVYHGDCIEVMRSLPDDSVDSVVTDPPYLIDFMGKGWDSADGIAGKPEVWKEALRVLKPGGHLLAFGGTRTWHRLAVAIEDAGFEIRDNCAWIYGSGFPKSLDVSKAIDKRAGAEGTYGDPKSAAHAGWIDRGRMRSDQGHEGYQRPWMQDSKAVDKAARQYAPATPAAQQWQGWGTALKPAHEPIVVARKPLIGTVAENVLTHGTGALNIDGCRIGTDSITSSGQTGMNARRFAHGARPADYGKGHAQPSEHQGRWPANVILDESQAAELDKQSGVLSSGANPTRRNSDKFRDAYGDFAGKTECVPARGADTGGASRFFYVAKAGKKERPNVDGVAHPTVKPIALMRYLVRLVTPPGGTVLEPFAGSGTTVEACILEGFDCIAIEMTDDYLPLIAERVRRSTEDKEGRLL